MKLVPLVVLLVACGDASNPSVDVTDATDTGTPDAADTGTPDAADIGPPDTAETDTPDTDTLDTNAPDGLDSSDAPEPSDASDITLTDTSEDAAHNDVADTASDVAADTTTPPEANPLFDLIGTVELELRPKNQWVDHDETRIAVAFRDRPYVDNYIEQLRIGDCTLYLQDDNVTCAPACAETETCQRDNTCHPFPTGASAGDITLTNLSTPNRPLTIGVVSTDPWVYYEDRLLDFAWFQPGDRIQIDAAGAAIPAFSALVEGVGPLDVTPGHELLMDTQQDLQITWNPAGDSSKIELILNAGWHGAPPVGVIRCEAKDADGQITVPQRLLVDLPYCAGICLFQHPNWIERFSRVVVETSAGPLAAHVYSRFPLHYWTSDF
jgi:hypothetical protein